MGIQDCRQDVPLSYHSPAFESADVEPEKFEDRYENALVELLNKKRKGEPVRTAVKPRDTGNLMDALRKSLSDVGKGGAAQPAKARKPKKAAAGQREMLMAISGKKARVKPRPKAPPRRQKVPHVSAGPGSICVTGGRLEEISDPPPIPLA